MRLLVFKLFFLFALLGPIGVKSQVSADALKAAYLIKIADNFNWEVSEQPIKVGFLSNNRDFLNRFQDYAQHKTIGGRQISIKVLLTAKALSEYDIIFVGAEKNKSAAKYIQNLNNSKTLLFTDLAPNLENSMVNFYMSFDNKLKFKINTNLLRLHQFEPSSLMLILGGSDNDILSLFEEKDSSIVLERNRALRLKQENFKQEEELKAAENKMESIKISMDNKNKEIEQKSKRINQINGKVELQKKYLNQISAKVHQTKKK